MSRRSQNSVLVLTALSVVAAVWLVSSEPWGLGVEQLAMFVAPGALLGLGASWAAHASTQRQWTWRRSRRAAFIGAATLPPVLAFIVAWDGNARPQRLLVGFVYAAWAALIIGGVVALIRRPPADV